MWWARACAILHKSWRHVRLKLPSPRKRLHLKFLNIRTNARENVPNICDYLTGKYARPFAGIITVACLKVCENIHRFLRSKRTETRENTRYRKHCSRKRTAQIDLLCGSPESFVRKKIRKGMFSNNFHWKNVAAVVVVWIVQCSEQYLKLI